LIYPEEMRIDTDTVSRNVGATDQAGKLSSRLTNQSYHHKHSALLFGAGKDA